jgi:hypothetical protein
MAQLTEMAPVTEQTHLTEAQWLRRGVALLRVTLGWSVARLPDNYRKHSSAISWRVRRLSDGG